MENWHTFASAIERDRGAKVEMLNTRDGKVEVND